MRSLNVFVKVKPSFVDHWTKGTLPSGDRLLVFNFILLFDTMCVIIHFWLLQKVLKMILEHFYRSTNKFEESREENSDRIRFKC